MPLKSLNFHNSVLALRSWGLPASSIAYLAGIHHPNLVYDWESGAMASPDIMDRIKLAARLGHELEFRVGAVYFPLFLYSNLAAVKYRMPIETIRTSREKEQEGLQRALMDFADTVDFTRPNPYPPRLRQYNIKRLRFDREA